MTKPSYRVRHFDDSQEHKGRTHPSAFINLAIKLAVITVVIIVHAGVLVLLSGIHLTSSRAIRPVSSVQPDNTSAIKVHLVKSDDVEESDITNRTKTNDEIANNKITHAVKDGIMNTQTNANITSVPQPTSQSPSQSTNQPLSEQTKKQPAETAAVTTNKDKPQPLADINTDTSAGRQTPNQSQPNPSINPPAKSKETAHNPVENHAPNHLTTHSTHNNQDRPSPTQASPNQESRQKATVQSRVQPSQPNNTRSTRNTDSVNSANGLNSTNPNSAKPSSAKLNSTKNPVIINDSKEINAHWKIAPQPSISIATRRQIKQAGKYTASFMLHVNQQGHITHIHLLQSSGSTHLDDDFARAINNASFHPFIRQGSPVYGVIMIKLDADIL